VPSRARLQAVYHVKSDARPVDERARAIAVEQSVEMPISAIGNDFVRREILGRVEGIREISAGCFEVRISLAQETIGSDAGQLINMLFGNSSLHDDLVLHDVELPPDLVKSFGGPRHGIFELRRRVGAPARALTCSPLKPQGLTPDELAQLARSYALGGIDYIKDDHGFANQAYAPFAERIRAVAATLRELEASTSRRIPYVPSLSGSLDEMRQQMLIAIDAGVEAVLVAPMIVGLSNFNRLVKDNPGIVFFVHPALAGAARIAPALLMGKLFRLFGADAVVFPHHGGRFGYSLDTCRALARTAVQKHEQIKPCMPVPAGGMSLARVGAMLDFYGRDVMLLIGGALLEQRERLIEAAAGFVAEVRNHSYRDESGSSGG
jgi:ribulose-bisphosphate carboxylase large chain